MKKIVFLLAIGFIMYSCGNSPDKSKDLNNPSDLNSGLNSAINQESVPSINDADNTSNKSSSSELNDLFNMGKNMVEGSKSNGEVDFQLDPEMLIDMLVESGVSRESMQVLINNPDSLKVLAQQAMKERLEARDNEEPVLKGKLTKEQLASKKTPTGVSLEEAILIVQAESGPEATMAKLKTIDSLAGTNMMSQLDLTEAGYVMGDVERKNEVKPSDEEEQKMKDDWCLGSQYWAKNPPIANYHPKYGILLDIVGGKNAKFPKEYFSTYFADNIVTRVWNAANRLGYSNYFVEDRLPLQHGITDDHRYVNILAKIPSIDIINYDMNLENPFGDFHHKHSDNMELIDKSTLNAVGQTVMEVIYQEK